MFFYTQMEQLLVHMKYKRESIKKHKRRYDLFNIYLLFPV